jgi:nucleotide-binding universal stress UspA family protein
MLPFRHILVATDFGPFSDRAVHLAVELVKEHGATLTLMTVIEPHTGDPESLAPLSDYLPPEWESETRGRLAAVARECGLLAGYASTVRFGEPSKMIVEEAHRNGVDLVVVGTHGRKGVTRWLLGSVAEHVVRNCPCPVLTVRGEEEIAARAAPEMPVEDSARPSSRAH